eukprot:15346932-Ditylum_brightwellii.AAC.1
MLNPNGGSNGSGVITKFNQEMFCDTYYNEPRVLNLFKEAYDSQEKMNCYTDIMDIIKDILKTSSDDNDISYNPTYSARDPNLKTTKSSDVTIQNVDVISLHAENLSHEGDSSSDSVICAQYEEQGFNGYDDSVPKLDITHPFSVDSEMRTQIDQLWKKGGSFISKLPDLFKSGAVEKVLTSSRQKLSKESLETMFVAVNPSDDHWHGAIIYLKEAR